MLLNDCPMIYTITGQMRMLKGRNYFCLIQSPLILWDHKFEFNIPELMHINCLIVDSPIKYCIENIHSEWRQKIVRETPTSYFNLTSYSVFQNESILSPQLISKTTSRRLKCKRKMDSESKGTISKDKSSIMLSTLSHPGTSLQFDFKDASIQIQAITAAQSTTSQAPHDLFSATNPLINSSKSNLPPLWSIITSCVPTISTQFLCAHHVLPSIFPSQPSSIFA